MSGMATQIGRPRGRDGGAYRSEIGSAEWWGMLTQKVETLTQITADNQQAMQQLVTQTGRMVSRQEMEDILDKRFIPRQESELVVEGLERRLEVVEGQLKAQPAITRSWLMLALSGGGCLVSLLGIFTSVMTALLIFGLEHLVK